MSVLGGSTEMVSVDSHTMHMQTSIPGIVQAEEAIVLNPGEDVIDLTSQPDVIEPGQARSLQRWTGKDGSFTVLRLIFDRTTTKVRRIVSGPRQYDAKKLGGDDWIDKIGPDGIPVPKDHTLRVVLENVASVPAVLRLTLVVKAGAVDYRQAPKGQRIPSAKPVVSVARRGVPSPKVKLGKSVAPPMRAVSGHHSPPRLTWDPMHPGGSVSEPVGTKTAKLSNAQDTDETFTVSLARHFCDAILRVLQHSMKLETHIMSGVEVALRAARDNRLANTDEVHEAVRAGQQVPVVVTLEMLDGLLAFLRRAPWEIRAQSWAEDLTSSLQQGIEQMSEARRAIANAPEEAVAEPIAVAEVTP